MSGGVDSSVAAYLAKKSGYEVFGIFMRNWHEDSGSCTNEQDLNMALRVAEALKINLHIYDFSNEYRDEVFKDFLDDYALGLTPNPDILCNKNVKFKHLLAAAKDLGSDLIATGHYARIIDDCLYEGIDPSKDQSYFLCALSQEQLSQAFFPLGNMCKTEVRAIARVLNLINAEKKDSTGICFIEPNNFKGFLKNYVLCKPGVIVDEHGKAIGQHQGIAFYTIGQRSGLQIGGMRSGNGQAWYVAEKLVAENKLIVVQGKEHPLLFKRSMQVTMPSIIDLPADGLAVRIRHLGQKHACKISYQKDHAIVEFASPVRAVTPGQYAAFYLNDRCLAYSRIIN